MRESWLKGLPALKVLVILGFIVLSALTVFLSLSAFTAPKIVALRSLSYAEKSLYWEQRITEINSQNAYQELARSIEGFSTVEQHDEGHIFGEALFRQEGLRGIATCDGRFLYACYHSFTIQGMQELGPEGAQTLYDACRDTLALTSGECEHGIGHGILGTMGHFDYTFDALKKALAVCDSLAPPSLFCSGGVFMEYGLRSMNRGSIDPRPLEEKDVLEPCTSLPDKYRASCVFWLPKWWVAADPDKDDHMLISKKMGAWCMSLPDSMPFIDACIRGIGNDIHVLTDEDPSRTAAVCEAVTMDPELNYTCHKQSAVRFLYFFSLSDSLKACEGLTEAGVEKCRREATQETEERRHDIRE